MNVTVNRAEFLAAAKRAASVAPLSSPLEPLRGILLETDRREGCLTISATNLEVSLVQTIPCTSLDADALVLNARLLEGMLDKLEGDSVTLIRMEQQPVVLLTSGLAAYRIGVWERGIFPQIESPYPADTVLVTGIPAMTKRTIFAVGEKKNTPLLRCVNLMFTPNGLKAVGSNGSCVVSAKGDSQSTGNISLLVPASSLGKLAHMCEDMLLDRLRQDCLYFLGFGNRCERCLWAGNIRDQIGYMKALWNSFPSAGKPEWLPWDEILALEARMTDDISAAGSEGFLPSGTVQSKYPK